MCEGFASAISKLKRGSCALSSVVTRGEVAEACESVGYVSRATLYTPFTTIVTFICQLLGADGSCQQAVNGLIAGLVAAGNSKCSSDTGGYCKARARLPESCTGSSPVNLAKQLKRRRTASGNGKAIECVRLMARR